MDYCLVQAEKGHACLMCSRIARDEEGGEMSMQPDDARIPKEAAIPESHTCPATLALARVEEEELIRLNLEADQRDSRIGCTTEETARNEGAADALRDAVARIRAVMKAKP